jgi:TolB-like protein/cytochrome c-type biogenesis protein CcmH/NrfG
MTRDDFESAVKEALRNHTRADLLIRSPLLDTRLATRGNTVAPSIAGLREALVEAARSLFADSRDKRLHRVLELTYFAPAPKQEAAAERLGMPFSTYRRHLTNAVDRLAEWLWHQEQSMVHEDHADGPAPATARPRLSIVVLPFLNVSQDPDLDSLVDGIVDSLMTDLSRALPGSFVISRSTAFTYKGRMVPVRQIGEELRVRYVLEGSVLADAARVRVNVQLVDAETDEHMWAERFDNERSDILRVQDEIVARLSRSVGVELVRSEAERSRHGGDAADLVICGNALAANLAQKDRAIAAVDLFRQALALDPDNVDAMVGIAATLTYQVVNQYQPANRDELLNEAETLIGRAIALASDHIGVMRARMVLLRARGRFTEAIVAARSVIAHNPGEPTAYRELGLNHLYLGQTRAAVDWFRGAERIAPRDRVRWTWLQGLGRALLQLREDAEAVEILRQAVDSNPACPAGLAYLAAAEALVGNMERARERLAKLEELDPGMTIRCFVEDRSPVPQEAIDPTYRRENERILTALRRAGMING